MRNKPMLTLVAMGLVAAACSGNGASDTTSAPPATRSTVASAVTVASGTAQTLATIPSPTPDPAPVADAAAPGASCPTAGGEWENALLYIEHNATDEDTGVHGFFGGEAWSELCIWDPSGQLILAADPTAQLGDLTVADLFFESREPPNSELAVAEIQAAFPQGEYKVAGTDFEGVARVGSATFTHNIPAEPTITAPSLAEDPETAAEALVSSAGLVVRWEPVTKTIFNDPVDIASYEIIVTKEDHEDPDALSRPIYDVHVGPNETALSVPAEFFEPDTVYELEVLAIEKSGNQTIALGFFLTAGQDAEQAAAWADASAFVEYNADGDDLGFHVEFDGEPWATATLIGPDGAALFELAGGSGLNVQGMSSNFFESAEYPSVEVSREQFFTRFPGGLYTLVGTDLEGRAVSSNVTFIDLIPDPPEIVAPADEAPVPVADLTIDWEPVTTPAGVTPVVYQVQLYPADPPEGVAPIDLNIDLTFEVPASVTEVRVPGELLAPGVEYEFELTVVDASGNRTFDVGTFSTG